MNTTYLFFFYKGKAFRIKTIRKSKLHNEEDLFILDDFMYKCFLFFSKSEYFTNNEKNCLHKRWGCL
jgi:hypothetical protein